MGRTIATTTFGMTAAIKTKIRITAQMIKQRVI
jgi:hypothetical protein